MRKWVRNAPQALSPDLPVTTIFGDLGGSKWGYRCSYGWFIICTELPSKQRACVEREVPDRWGFSEHMPFPYSVGPRAY